MIAPMPSKTETNIKLPFSFIIYSLLAFAASQFILLFNGASMLDGVFRIPVLWMAAHLMLLGWALMVAMGAMYQLVPVVFLTPIWSEKFGFIQFGVTAIGITGFAIALGFYPQYALHTGLLTLAGILMFLYQMLRTIKAQKNRDILHLIIGSALVFLLLTIGIGILLAANFSIGISGFDHEAMLKTHILFGVAGWFSLLIFGFSYKMVPMFSLAHGFSMKLAKPVYGFYAAGLVVGSIGFFGGNQMIIQLAAFLLWIGFTFFTFHVKQIIDKRLKKNLDKPFTFSLIAIIIGWALHLIGAVMTLLPDVPASAYGILVYLYLFGWVIFSIIGYLYKIVPFLWWTYKYSSKLGKENVPALKELINEQYGVVIFSLFSIGLIGMAVALMSQLSIIFYASQGLLVVVSILFGGAIVNAVRK